MLCSDVVDNIYSYLPEKTQIKIMKNFYDPSIHKKKQLLNFEVKTARCDICGKISKQGNFEVLCLSCYYDVIDDVY